MSADGPDVRKKFELLIGNVNGQSTWISTTDPINVHLRDVTSYLALPIPVVSCDINEKFITFMVAPGNN